MINYYQPYLWPFLQPKKNSLPQGVRYFYYHSFEDGLWDFLRHKFPESGKITFLVPTFYCSDVLDNLKLHGCKYIYYPLDKNFQISVSRFRKYLWVYKPDMVVIFNACGITSDLFRDPSWLSDLPADSWILEDNVHNLTDPQNLRLLTSRHIVMDSLRKVSPIPGSRLFGSQLALNFTPNKGSYFSRYFLSSFFYYLIFRFVFIIGIICKSSRIIIWAHDFWLSKHDDIIGDSFVPQSGFSVFKPFITRLNYQKISRLKISQVKIYEKIFKNIFKNNYFYQINIPEKDFGNLHVYPLGFAGAPDLNLEKYLEDHGVPVWFKFTDSPWCENRGVLFLPLGFHMNEAKITKIRTIISAWIDQKQNSYP